MAIRLKVAETSSELDDVFWLRHEVFVVEDGKFGGKPLPTERISDKFDAVPKVANIIAYDGNDAVGTVRATLDTGIGLPSSEYYDFSPYLAKLQTEHKNLCLASGGMFAIREEWRGRRNVIHALLKLITGVYRSWGVTHVVATSNHETVSVYERLGFEAIDGPVWIDSIGNEVVPMVCEFRKMYQWAFGNLLESALDDFWLDSFSDYFHRLILSPGEVLFQEGDPADEAYIVDNGWMTISRQGPDGEALALATLSRGAILGELALMDSLPRSATAMASTNVELIQFDRAAFLRQVSQNQEKLSKLLEAIASRVRRTDDLAMVLAFAPQTGRVKFALEDLRKNAVRDKRQEGVWMAKVGPDVIARSAGVREHEVRRVLEMEKLSGKIEYGERMIKFLK